jgi:N-carbamoyl-L-amino-acid hydrolase
VSITNPTAAIPAASVVTAELRQLAIELFDTFRAMSFDGVGISRETYGPAETAAIEIIERVARDHDLPCRWDAARNLIVRLPGREPARPAVATGSHLDSVPQGGNFDGAAGVVASLMGLIAAQQRGPALRDVELYVLRAEESAWYSGPCYFGSRALFGQLTPADFASRHRSSGHALEHHMAACGADLAPLKAGRALLDPARLACWIELHIEQGPVLIGCDKPVGLVTGIRGNVRRRQVVCRGEAGHSGAVPRAFRHDAVLAMADLLARLDEHWRIVTEGDGDLVFTSGIVATDPKEHAVSRIPGEVTFALEFRSQDATTLDAFEAVVRSECNAIGAKRGVAFDLGHAVRTEPAHMAQSLLSVLQCEAETAEIPFECMASGAGHDSAVFANAGVPSAMIFVRNRHGSHNPREAMEYPDFFAGAEVLARALWQAANREEEFRS